MSAEEWLVPGGQAVILQPYARGGSLRAEPVTVEKVMKRDVVLSSGDRFRKDSLSKQIGGSWGTTLYLVPSYDPRVAETQREIRHQNAKSRALTAVDKWRRGDLPTREVVEAFTKVEECEIEALDRIRPEE